MQPRNGKAAISTEIIIGFTQKKVTLAKNAAGLVQMTAKENFHTSRLLPIE